MSSIDVFLFSSAPSGPQKTLILGVYGISNLVMCAKRVILSLSNQFPSLELHNREQNGRVDDLSASKGTCAFSTQRYRLFYPVLLLLGAFAEFVSEFDMPSGSSSKNKDASVLETGRPFSLAMFEGVL
ncbi:unnamed protein product [Prunus armeniaca]